MTTTSRSKMAAAVAEYLRREAIANRAMQGAKHQQIISDVAREAGVDRAALIEAVLDASFARLS